MWFIVAFALGFSAFGQELEKPPAGLENKTYTITDSVTGDIEVVSSKEFKLVPRIKQKPKPKVKVKAAPPPPPPPSKIIEIKGDKVEVPVYRPFFIGGALGRGRGGLDFKEGAEDGVIEEKEQFVYQLTAGWRFSYDWSVYGVITPDRSEAMVGAHWSFGSGRVR